MTLEELYQGLKSIVPNVTYYSFSKPVSYPAIAYFVPDTSNFSADGIAYLQVKNVNIELYTEKKDLEIEQKIADFLIKNGLFFEQEEDYINSEKLIRNTYFVSI